MYLKPSRHKRMRRRTSILIVIIIVILAVAGVLLFLDNFTEFSFSKPLLKETETRLPDTTVASAGGILYVTDSMLYLLDQNGSSVWDLKQELVDPKVTCSDQIICLYAQKSLQAFSFEKEPLFSTSLDSDVLSARCSNTAVAALTSAADETGVMQYYISLFNNKGEPAAQRIELAAKPVLDFGFNTGGDLFWVLSLDSSGVVPVSYITTYKTDGSITGSIEINTQVIEKVYVTSDSIFASGSNNLLSYSYVGAKQADALIYGWQPTNASLDGTNLKISYISRANLATIESTRIYASDLSYQTVHLPRDVFSLALSQTKLFAYTPNEIYSYTPDGKPDKSVKLDQTISTVKQLSGDIAVVWDQTKSYIMHLN